MNLLNIGIHFPITDPTWIFFLVLMIILFAPILLGRLRIPHIIGMILAGVAIGKYGFNILVTPQEGDETVLMYYDLKKFVVSNAK